MIETVPSGTVLHERYRVERVLGSGGFGHVYLVLDLSMNQQYALKEYLISGPGGQEQLMHEANVLSQLHHPNLPAFHDAFNERGRYYVIINYIEGEDLTDIIRITQRRNEAISLIQIIGWILATCDAVLFLHNQRPPVIHRDIKPDNIRIMPNGTAILVDLGNAKAYADGLRTLLFIRHQGTPGYAPPEQYPGGSGTDTRSDVYALGATLYFAITAHEPPSVSTRNQAMQQGQPDLPALPDLLAKNPSENSPEANEVKQFRLGVSKPAKPAPRHSRHLAQLGAFSPLALSQLNSILQRSMAMRPKDRYQHVADFANDLNRVMTTMMAEVQQAKPTTNPYGTQPNLPMLYEDMQNAKAAEAAKQQNVSSPSHPQLEAVSHCPECNASLMRNAPFCPNCGIPLGAKSGSERGRQTSDTSSVGRMQAQQGRFGLADHTITAPPQDQQPPKTPSPALNTRNNGTQEDVSAWSTAQVTQTGTGRPRNTTGATTARRTMRQKPTPSGFAIGPRLILAVLVLLVLLIAVMIVLLINATHHAEVQLPQTAFLLENVAHTIRALAI